MARNREAAMSHLCETSCRGVDISWAEWLSTEQNAENYVFGDPGAEPAAALDPGGRGWPTHRDQPARRDCGLHRLEGETGGDRRDDGASRQAGRAEGHRGSSRRTNQVRSALGTRRRSRSSRVTQRRLIDATLA